jgi:hypothetical protein
MQLLRAFIFAGGFLPHGYWHVRTPDLRVLHAVSDCPMADWHLSIPRQIRSGPVEICG